MNQSLTLPMADKFYHDKQTSAFIRSVNVSWEIPEENHYYLEYSYNRKDWYALNGGFSIILPCEELPVSDALANQDPNGEKIAVSGLFSLQIWEARASMYTICLQNGRFFRNRTGNLYQ